MKNALIGILTFAALISPLSAESSEAIRIAIIPGEGERAPKAGIVDLLTAELSSQDDIVLLEREEIQKVLAEQNLTAEGLTDLATAIKLGKLLAVELFVFVEKVPKAKPAALRIQLIETRTGIVLASVLQHEESLEKDLSELTRNVQLSLAKLKTPDKERRYVGILGFRSEELGHYLDGLAEALGMLLATDLNKSPSVILLDREHLGRLKEEENLTGIDFQLKSSSVLLECGVKRMPGGKQYSVTVVLRPLVGSAPEPITIQAPADDIAATRKAVAGGLLAELKAIVPGQIAGNLEKEAAIFSQQGTKAAAEAAYVLHPTQARLLAIAHVADGTRSKELLCRYWRNEVVILLGQGKEVDLPDIFGLSLPKPLSAGPEVPTGGARHVIDTSVDFTWWNRIPIRNPNPTAEDIRLEKEILTYKLACEAANAGDGSATLKNANRCIRGWSKNAKEWAEYFRRMLEFHLARTRSLGKAGCNPSFMRHLCIWQQGHNRFTKPAGFDDIEPTLEWMRQQDDDMMALCSYMVKVYGNSYGEAGAARKALDYIVSRMPLSHPVREADNDWLIQQYAEACFLSISRDSLELKKYMCACMDPLLESGDIPRFMKWMNPRHSKRLWSNVLEHHMSEEEQIAWLKRMVEKFEAYEKTGAPGSVLRGANRQMICDYKDRIARLEKRPFELPEEWSHYSIEALHVGVRPKGAGPLLRMVKQANRLVLIWQIGGRSRNTSFGIHATSMPISGGDQTSLGTGTVRYPRGHGLMTQISGVAADDSRVYVGTLRSGLVVFENGKTTVWDEASDLGAASVDALTLCRGKLYLGMSGGGGALYCFDPIEKRCIELASSRSKTVRNDLDGGPSYRIGAILGDEARECLWVGFYFDRPGRSGLWRYDLRTGEAKRVGGYGGVGHLTWESGKILSVRSAHLDHVVLFDPETYDVAPLLMSTVWKAPVFGGSNTRAWPAVLIRDHLITGAGKGASASVAVRGFSFHFRRKGELYLYTSSIDKPTLLTRMPAGESPEINCMVKLNEDTVLMANAAGKFWKVTRKPDTQKKAMLCMLNANRGAFSKTNAVPVAKVSASSFAPDIEKTSFRPEMIADGNGRTAWASTPEGSKGAWISFEFPEKVSISRIMILNGWFPWRNPSFYGHNHRAKKISIHYDNGKPETCYLHDLNCPQYHTATIKSKTKTVKLVFDEIYPADVVNPDDPPWLNIREVTFFGEEATR